MQAQQLAREGGCLPCAKAPAPPARRQASRSGGGASAQGGAAPSSRRVACEATLTPPPQQPAAEAAASAAAAAAAAAEPANGAGAPPTYGPWQALDELQRELKSQEVVQGQVVGFNKGGVMVHLHKAVTRAFIPFSQLDCTKEALRQSNGLDFLMAKNLDLVVTSVESEKRRVVCSEIRALMHHMARTLEVGQWVDGVVYRLVDFGAFVRIKSPDGSIRGEIGKVPLRELSWQYIHTPEAAVQVGQEVRCRVLGTEPAKNRIYLSLREEQSPLQQTLDALLPDTAEGEFEVPVSLPPAMEDVCTALKAEARISDITLGRQVEEKAVSQDLEVYIRRQRAELGGFDLVARAGRQVQEIHVKTDLSAAEMRQTVQDIVSRIL